MKKFSVEDLVRFMRQNYPRVRSWDKKKLSNWVSWAIENRFLFLVGEGDTITGLVIARTVMNAVDGREALHYDPEGKCYFIDMAVITYPKLQSLQAVAFSMIKRFGMRDEIAYQMHGKGPILVSDAHVHRNKLLRRRNVVS